MQLELIPSETTKQSESIHLFLEPKCPLPYPQQSVTKLF
jgi:hypothetical protein